ncbi:hypothetical protein [Parageobacillus galactosidasius]|uniref:Uncharacterized protein n=1 Tax=Parageobacillus galactosidasius TaxID=883812 RepID=A0A226QT41_9BACL|nr:hypothetical protein [Parageobacillus galactosidasius]OXB94760.1 hypothetical protein B9L23_07815 [Parageobacillus galactosidasius]
MAMVRQHPDYPKWRMKIGIMPDFSGSKISSQEIPIGVCDGANKVFKLANKPLKHSEEVVKDGMVMKRDLDYTIDYATGTITFSDHQIPQPKSVIHVTYKYMGA